MAGLYIHVPFCASKCAYCDFYSEPLAAGDERPAAYFRALALEGVRRPAGFEPDTIFLGGGTPTLLAEADLARLLELVRAWVRPAAVVEWTCEANPGTLDAAKLRLLRQAGVNRLSLGIQSFDARNLAFLGRRHSARDAEAAVDAARAAGFSNINLDLLFAVPGAPPGALARDLERTRALAPEHVAAYALIFEEGTPLARRRAAGEAREVSDAVQLRQFRLVRRALAEAGFRHYEISNYARSGFECRHNLLYWGLGEYLGFGPAAHSHWDGRRWGNVRSLRAYVAALEEGRAPMEFEERLEPEARAREGLVMGLRRLEGVDQEAFAAETGFAPRALRGPEVERLVVGGLLEERDGRLRLTEKGLFVSDAVFRDLV